MSTKPFITIITPTYNREALLPKAISSIVEQEGQNKYNREHIIVDDGSTDNTKQIVEQRQQKYPQNIFYYYQKNSGIPGVARNTGIEKLNKYSDYIIFLDSDDWLTKDCFLVCLNKRQKLRERKKYDMTTAISFYCETDTGNLIGSQDFFGGENEYRIDYDKYLQKKINREIGTIRKTSLFLNNKEFRFENDIISESVLRSKIRKWADEKEYKQLLINYTGRIYGTENQHNQNKVTKNRSSERFIKNALGNERIVNLIGKDLLNKQLTKTYANYLFKAGINRILAGKNKRGRESLKQSINSHKSIQNIVVYVLANTLPSVIHRLYKLYLKTI